MSFIELDRDSVYNRYGVSSSFNSCICYPHIHAQSNVIIKVLVQPRRGNPTVETPSGIFSMMSSRSNLYISCSTFQHKWNGVWRCGCATGEMALSMTGWTCLFFCVPSPRNTGACLSRMCARFLSFIVGVSFEGAVWLFI